MQRSSPPVNASRRHDRPRQTAVRIAALCLLAAVAGPACADAVLARSRQCLGCHAVERRVVGPALRDIATRYAPQLQQPQQQQREAVVERLAAKIRLGGGGAWGPVPMPANLQVSEAEARRLALWVLAQR